LAVLAPAAGAAGKEAFVDYYVTASTLISSLNSIAADAEKMDLADRSFPVEAAEDIKSRLVKAREGFDSVLTYDDRTNEINEGYILYIDKMLLALMVAKEYREEGGTERRDRLAKLLAESAELRAQINAQVRQDKKKYGLN
jgi:hypothetical protein